MEEEQQKPTTLKVPSAQEILAEIGKSPDINSAQSQSNPTNTAIIQPVEPITTPQSPTSIPTTPQPTLPVKEAPTAQNSNPANTTVNDDDQLISMSDKHRKQKEKIQARNTVIIITVSIIIIIITLVLLRNFLISNRDLTG